MPIDPNISLGIAPAPNPMETLGKFAGTQQAIQQMRLFQQTYQARQMAGQIMATSPDMETAMQRLGQSPAAAYLPDVMSMLRATQKTSTEIAGLEQTQNSSALGAVVKGAFGAAYSDPSRLPSAMAEQIAALPKDIAERPEVQKAIASFQYSLLSDLPTDPAQARQVYQLRLAGNGLANGVTPEVVRALAGESVIQDAGGRLVGGIKLPPQLGGGFQPSTSLGKTLAPTVVQAAGDEGSFALIGGDSGVPSARPEASAGNPLAPISGPTGKQPTKQASPSSAPGKSSAGSSFGPTAEQAGVYKGLAEAGKSVIEEQQANASGIPTTMITLDKLNKSLQGFQAGGGAQMRSTLGQWAQAIGAKQDVVDGIANGSLPDTQVFQKVVRPYLISELAKANQGNGRAFQVEVVPMMKAMEASTDPRALIEMLNMFRQKASLAYDKSNKLTDYMSLLDGKDPSVKGMHLAQYDTWYNKTVDPKNLPKSNESGGLSFVPVETAKGVTPPGRKTPINWDSYKRK